MLNPSGSGQGTTCSSGSVPHMDEVPLIDSVANSVYLISTLQGKEVTSKSSSSCMGLFPLSIRITIITLDLPITLLMLILASFWKHGCQSKPFYFKFHNSILQFHNKLKILIIVLLTCILSQIITTLHIIKVKFITL